MAFLAEKLWNTRATLFWKLDRDQLSYSVQCDDGVSCGGTGDGSLEIESHELGVWGPKCRRDCGDEAGPWEYLMPRERALGTEKLDRHYYLILSPPLLHQL